jgi:excisionase family DNA binding protein
VEYVPITKVEAAKVLSVSARTIDNMIADGSLPALHYIGRKAYWHPEVFYAWLDARLGVQRQIASDITTLPTSQAIPPRRGRPRKSGR